MIGTMVRYDPSGAFRTERPPYIRVDEALLRAYIAMYFLVETKTYSDNVAKSTDYWQVRPCPTVEKPDKVEYILLARSNGNQHYIFQHPDLGA